MSNSAPSHCCRWLFVLALALLAAMQADAEPIDPESHHASPVVPEIAAAGYHLVFSDEFNGKTLDLQKWLYRTDSKALSTQLPANVSVSGGNLHLALKKEVAGGKNFTGGGVISNQAFKYGYFEARFKVPHGAGWHTSFWAMQQTGGGNTTLPTLADQEIDFCEQDSVKLTDYSAGVIDWSSASKKGKSFGRQHIQTPDLAAGFHVWSCEFTPTTVKFYFDGKLTHQTDATKFPHNEQNIWLTSIAYKAKGKGVDESQLPSTADYDYVRFYEKTEPSPIESVPK